jgi:hypothetical protein
VLDAGRCRGSDEDGDGVEAVHIGFGGTDALKQTLKEQLEVLASGGHLEAAEKD